MNVAFAGLAALVVAMGIGRFAFTPLLPMMQADSGLTLAQGGYLAAANYIGYLVGALWAMRPVQAAVAIRASLVAIAVTTLAMGVTHGMPAWRARGRLSTSPPGRCSGWRRSAGRSSAASSSAVWVGAWRSPAVCASR